MISSVCFGAGSGEAVCIPEEAGHQAAPQSFFLLTMAQLFPVNGNTATSDVRSDLRLCLAPTDIHTQCNLSVQLQGLFLPGGSSARAHSNSHLV